MARLHILSVLIFLCTASLTAQTLAPCGTASHKSEWLANFQKRGIDLSQRPIDFRIQINAHRVGNDAGDLFNYGLMLESLAALERDYDSTRIGFAINLPVDTLRASAYNSHQSVLEGADMMFTNNRENALNIYFLNNPAGNCGYNLPYAGIAMANQCSGFSGKTISHEVGHALSLPHPFLGWEGGQNDDGSVPPDFSQPAPQSVTYDYTYFQDTLIRDTLIIDTAIVELVARTNCYEAADGFCDTPADYIASRWTCTGDGVSAQSQIDPDGQRFTSDGTLIMGYADRDCQARFSEEQKVAMEAFAQSQRPSWIRTTFDTNRVRGTSTLELDASGVTLSADELTFTALDNATHYFIEISERRTFSSLALSAVTTANSVPLDPSIFEPNELYYARIYPFNDHSFLAGMSPRMEFTVAEGTSNSKEVNVFEFSMSPNPVRAGSLLNLSVRSDISRIDWYDARGALVQQQQTSNINQIEVPVMLSSGVYNLMLLGEDGNRYTGRVQVLR